MRLKLSKMATYNASLPTNTRASKGKAGRVVSSEKLPVKKTLTRIKKLTEMATKVSLTTKVSPTKERHAWQTILKRKTMTINKTKMAMTIVKVMRTQVTILAMTW
jgi:uncharacterized protein YwgA